MVAIVVGEYQQIDVLYNNAGINYFGKLVDTEEAAWDRVMTVNVKSVFLTSKYILPVMAAQKKGVIINTGSSASLVGLENLAVYTASKGAVLQLTPEYGFGLRAGRNQGKCTLPGRDGDGDDPAGD